jgi:hypothetical protein
MVQGTGNVMQGDTERLVRNNAYGRRGGQEEKWSQRWKGGEEDESIGELRMEKWSGSASIL